MSQPGLTDSSCSRSSTAADMNTWRERRRGSLPPVPEKVDQFQVRRRFSLLVTEREIRAGSLLKLPQTLPDKDTGNSLRGSVDWRFTNDSHRQSLMSGLYKWSNTIRDSTLSLSPNPPHLKIKLILLGDSGVGKSTFLQTLLSGQYTPASFSTNLAMAHICRNVDYKGKEVEIDFHDTAGQEKYRSLTASYYRHAHGSFVFFNVHNKQSFSNVESWLQDLNKYNGRDAVILVGLLHRPQQVKPHKVGTSSGSDQLSLLASDWHYLNSHQPPAVPRAQAEHMAGQWNVPYIEMDTHNEPFLTTEAMYTLLDLIFKNNDLFPPGKSSIIINSKKVQHKCCTFCY